MNNKNQKSAPAANPLVETVGAAPRQDDPFLQEIAAMPGFKVEAFLSTSIKRSPETIIGHANVKQLLTRTGNSAFQFAAISVKLASVTYGVTEIHAAIDFVATGHLPGNHRRKRIIDGEATVVFLPREGIVFEVNYAEVNPDGKSAVGAADSDSPKWQ